MNLKQLSQKLGLSPTTVSRALNGYPEVSEETRARVRAAAQEFRYRPNSRAKGLATGRAMVIGHVLTSSTRHEMVNPIFGDFIAGAAKSYAEHGYDALFTYVEEGDERAAYRSLRDRHAVDGIILQGPKVDEPRIEILQDLGIPFVVHGRSSGCEVPYSWVDVNNMRAFHRACNFLLDLGHRRIGLINGAEDLDFAHRRRDGYVQALSEAGVIDDPALMHNAEMTEVYGYGAMLDFMARPDPPTAVLVSSVISAMGVRRAIEGAGLKLGRDISVITYDDELSYLKNGTDLPIFTATRSSVRQAGEVAAEMLMQHIAQPDAVPTYRLLEADLVVGSSTGPAPKDTL